MDPSPLWLVSLWEEEETVERRAHRGKATWGTGQPRKAEDRGLQRSWTCLPLDSQPPGLWQDRVLALMPSSLVPCVAALAGWHLESPRPRLLGAGCVSTAGVVRNPLRRHDPRVHSVSVWIWFTDVTAFKFIFWGYEWWQTYSRAWKGQRALFGTVHVKSCLVHLS